MAGIIARLTNPLRHIDADPDQLVREAYQLLQDAESNQGLWPAMSAYSDMASVKIQLAQYLKEHHGR
ncbi:hypothetical protein [Streptomyces uncialis]|uniref:hypothetical protein n=1 Tax=Streptomyces uncialis TaxID=1048205 RepID=UPI0037AF37C6